MTEVQGYTARWAAPEVLESGDRNTPEADTFAFAMVMIEVGVCVSTFSVGWDTEKDGLPDTIKGFHKEGSVQRVHSHSHHFKDY